MKKIISEKFPRIIRNKDKIEEELGIKLTNRGKEIFIEGDSVSEYIAEKIIDAIDFGFPIPVAFLIKDEDFVFEELNIKDYTKRKKLSEIRARIIGAGGKTFKTLSDLTDCNFELKDNRIGIIGSSDNIKGAQAAIISLIQGAKQANVYSYLEKHRPEPIIDLGLKDKF